MGAMKNYYTYVYDSQEDYLLQNATCKTCDHMHEVKLSSGDIIYACTCDIDFIEQVDPDRDGVGQGCWEGDPDKVVERYPYVEPF